MQWKYPQGPSTRNCPSADVATLPGVSGPGSIQMPRVIDRPGRSRRRRSVPPWRIRYASKVYLLPVPGSAACCIGFQTRFRASTGSASTNQLDTCGKWVRERPGHPLLKVNPDLGIRERSSSTNRLDPCGRRRAARVLVGAPAAPRMRTVACDRRRAHRAPAGARRGRRRRTVRVTGPGIRLRPGIQAAPAS